MLHPQAIREQIDDLLLEARAPLVGQPGLGFRRRHHHFQPFAERVLAEIVERCRGPRPLQKVSH
jgi:hypothetical protein